MMERVFLVLIMLVGVMIVVISNGHVAKGDMVIEERKPSVDKSLDKTANDF